MKTRRRIEIRTSILIISSECLIGILHFFRSGSKTSGPAGAEGWTTTPTRCPAIWASPRWCRPCQTLGSWATWCPRLCPPHRWFLAISSALANPLPHQLRHRVQNRRHKWPHPNKHEVTFPSTCQCTPMECFHRITTADCEFYASALFFNLMNTFLSRRFVNKV